MQRDSLCPADPAEEHNWKGPRTHQPDIGGEPCAIESENESLVLEDDDGVTWTMSTPKRYAVARIYRLWVK